MGYISDAGKARAPGLIAIDWDFIYSLLLQHNSKLSTTPLS